MTNSYQNATLIIGVLDITLYLEISKLYTDYKNVFGKYIKNVIIEGLSQDTISNMNFSEELPEDVDLLVYPIALNLLTERANGSVTAISKIFGATPLIMLATTPQSISVTSFQMDFADKWTWLGILLSIITVSFLLSVSETFNNRDSKKRIQTKKILEFFLIYTWDSAMIFFFEPFGSISKRGSQRIICGIWFLACVVIVNEITGAMKSKYSSVKYNYIKDVDEITPGSRWQPRCLDGQSADRFLQLMSSSDTKFKYVVDKMKRFDTSDVAGVDFYQEIEEDDVLFYSYASLYVSIGVCLEAGLFEKDELPRFYISKPINEMHAINPLSFKVLKNEQIKNHIDFVYFSIMETKWMYEYEAHYRFHLDSITWHPLTTETNSINLMDVIPIFKIFFYGQLISALTLIFELLISYQTGKLQLYF